MMLSMLAPAVGPFLLHLRQVAQLNLVSDTVQSVHVLLAVVGLSVLDPV